MIIKDAKFVVSNTDITKCPEDGKPEYAFIGRSNVGKSSLINMLTDRKNLAKTSGTPGKTQLINHFVLLDSRLEPQKIDLEFMTWCAEEQLPFSIVFTKIDKLSSSALQKNLAAYKKEMLKQWAEMPPVFTTSAESKFGREKLLNYIGQINMDLKQTEQFGD